MSELMTKHEMTEEDIKLQYITPAIESAGWDKLKQIKMEYNFTDGRVIVRGNVTARGKRKRTDYLLYYKPNIPLAIVEAKDNRHSVGARKATGHRICRGAGHPVCVQLKWRRFLGTR